MHRFNKNKLLASTPCRFQAIAKISTASRRDARFFAPVVFAEAKSLFLKVFGSRFGDLGGGSIYIFMVPGHFPSSSTSGTCLAVREEPRLCSHFRVERHHDFRRRNRDLFWSPRVNYRQVVRSDVITFCKSWATSLIIYHYIVRSVANKEFANIISTIVLTTAATSWSLSSWQFSWDSSSLSAPRPP